MKTTNLDVFSLRDSVIAEYRTKRVILEVHESIVESTRSGRPYETRLDPPPADPRAEVFHRAGLIEKWGRETNRVAAMCRAAGLAPPDFAEIAGAAVVTFPVRVAASGTGAESRAESLERRVLESLTGGDLSKGKIAVRLGMGGVTGHLNRAVTSLLGQGLIEYTIPDRPTSRLQRYRLKRTVENGRARALPLLPRPGSRRQPRTTAWTGS